MIRRAIGRRHRAHRDGGRKQQGSNRVPGKEISDSSRGESLWRVPSWC
jgi:hypothetical protein